MLYDNCYLTMISDHDTEYALQKGLDKIGVEKLRPNQRTVIQWYVEEN